MDEPDKNDGNFRSLLRYRAKSGDVILKEHLETTSSRELYTSPIIQNEIITIFGELIQSHLVNEISKVKFFTVLADETTDITQVEQFSLCIRYFDETLMQIREDFLTFVPVDDVTGLGLANTLQNTLEKLGFDLNKLRGQGYDGAAAMRGSFRGVQAIIKEKYPKALYTHCVSHSLNLCLSDAAKIQDIRNNFGVISDCCSFFNCSAKRTTILKNKILEIKPNVQATKLKSLCETRWVLRHESVFAF
ncbi:52 kDa repressor of the inhibitor of the protein kinase-like [Aphis gossypii]|uniref:52 kDa repressor of the inhibitor of the protein kinase-like n=1 Tax=Aphis gossypii TaxID=80765 RepID=UPI00215982DB|nr:52 kDa repressor of the inhibitor of the protein kinase-like [Aphis gossypii]